MTGTPGRELAIRSALAVCAHPDDESFGLGAVLSTFATLGIETRLLCFTHGDASTLGAVGADLGALRSSELAAAVNVLGVVSLRLLSYTDGALTGADLETLADEVEAVAAPDAIDCLLVFDEGGITGHADHQRATAAALVTAERLGLPVLAWTLRRSVADALNDEFGAGFIGREPTEIDLEIEVDRARQLTAIACHASQSNANPVLWRRLALQGTTESLRWLGRRRPQWRR